MQQRHIIIRQCIYYAAAAVYFSHTRLFSGSKKNFMQQKRHPSRAEEAITARSWNPCLRRRCLLYPLSWHKKVGKREVCTDDSASPTFLYNQPNTKNLLIYSKKYLPYIFLLHILFYCILYAATYFILQQHNLYRCIFLQRWYIISRQHIYYAAAAAS